MTSTFKNTPYTKISITYQIVVATPTNTIHCSSVLWIFFSIQPFNNLVFFSILFFNFINQYQVVLGTVLSNFFDFLYAGLYTGIINLVIFSILIFNIIYFGSEHLYFFFSLLFIILSQSCYLGHEFNRLIQIDSGLFFMLFFIFFILLFNIRLVGN